AQPWLIPGQLQNPLHHKVQNVLLVPQYMRGPKPHVVQPVAGDLERSVAVSQFTHVKHHVGAGAHVVRKCLSTRVSKPSHGAAVSCGYALRTTLSRAGEYQGVSSSGWSFSFRHVPPLLAALHCGGARAVTFDWE